MIETKEQLRNWRLSKKGKRGRGKVGSFMSQNDAAVLIGVSKHTYVKWENGSVAIPKPITNLLRFI